MIYSGAYDAIANYNGKLYFFPIPDYSLMADSSLLLNWIDKESNRYNFMAYNRSKHLMENIGSSTLKNWVLNQVGTSVMIGNDNKEVIRTLGGKNITWDHSNNTIRGALPSTVGYMGNEIATCSPFPLDEPADNGKVWSVSHWFNF
jgi:hypothetical protein